MASELSLHKVYVLSSTNVCAVNVPAYDHDWSTNPPPRIVPPHRNKGLIRPYLREFLFFLDEGGGGTFRGVG